MKKWKKALLLSLCALLFLLSVGVVVYPLLSNRQMERQQNAVLAEYDAMVAEDEAVPALLEAARVYNALLVSGQYTEEDLAQATALFGSELIGRVDIPAISVSLPIYTSDTALEKGAVHVRGTSLPVGGESVHAAVSAHSGMSSARMFTDLERLQIGDRFTVQCLGETLYYEVDQITTVTPDDVSELAILPGEEHCTLITCTPYGVNSHRLLVRGRRIELDETEKDLPVISKAEKTYSSFWMQQYIRGILCGLGIVAVIAAALITLIFIRKRRHTKCRETQ